MSRRRSGENDPSSIPEAIPVSEEDIEHQTVLITEETLTTAKKAADEELFRIRKETKKKHERELKDLETRLDGEVKSIRSLLDDTERREKMVREAVWRAATAREDSIHQAKLAQLEREAEVERIVFQERKREWVASEEKMHARWLADNPLLGRVFRERKDLREQRESGLKALVEDLAVERRRMERQWKQVEDDWRRQCNELNSKHRTNLLVGLALGGLLGYILDRSSRM